MLMLTFKNYSVRFIDRRPKLMTYQVNIYNPDVEGHSLAFMVELPPEFAGTVTDVFDNLVNSGDLDAQLEKALTAFANYVPTPEV
jgi:hypothetical protein